MSGWLDRWARHTARTPHSTIATSPDSETASTIGPATSRRDFMKKAAVVGAAVWSVPVMQTALAPAASASGGGLNAVCGPSQPCAAPYACGTDGRCGGTGANCGGAAALCVSGGCSTNGKCAAAHTAPKGSTCLTNSACTSGTWCSGAGYCSVGVGGTCSGNTQCYTSGLGCIGNTCWPSSVGHQCRTDNDCWTIIGRTCTSINTTTGFGVCG